MTGETKPVHQLGGSTLSIRGWAPTQGIDRTMTIATTKDSCRMARRSCGVVTAAPKSVWLCEGSVRPKQRWYCKHRVRANRTARRGNIAKHLVWKLGGWRSTVSDDLHNSTVHISRGVSSDGAKTKKKLLANLEHEFRVPRHPVWLGTSDGQHERHLRVPGRDS